MSKINQRHDQTLRSFASLLTVEKNVRDDGLHDTQKTLSSNKVVKEMFKLGNSFGKGGSDDTTKIERDDPITTPRYIFPKSGIDNLLTEQISISPTFKGFLSSYGCGLNETTCHLPALRTEMLENPRESLPTAVLKSFLKTGNPFPPTTSSAKGKKKLQHRRRRSSKISLKEPITSEAEDKSGASDEKNETNTDKTQHTFETLVHQMSESLFQFTQSTSSSAKNELRSHEEMDIAIAPHLINYNIRATMQTLMEARMKCFMQILVRKSIIKNNGLVTEGVAAVLSHHIGIHSATELSDQIQILKNWEREEKQKEIKKKSTVNLSDHSDLDDDTNHETKIEKNKHSKIAILNTKVADVTFISEIKSRLNMKLRKAMVIKKCVTSFDVPRGVVGTVVRLRRQSMALGIGKMEKEGNLSIANGKDVSQKETKGEKSNESGANEKGTPVIVPTTEVTLPLTFAAIIDADMGWNNSQNFVIEFGCPGEIKGTFGGPAASCVLTGVDITLDTESLLRDMENQIRFIIRRAMVIAINSVKKARPKLNSNSSLQSTRESNKYENSNKSISPPSNLTESDEENTIHRQSMQIPDYDTHNEIKKDSKNKTCTKSLRATKLLRQSPTNASVESEESDNDIEDSNQLFVKPTTHLNNLHGLSNTTKKVSGNASGKTGLQTFVENVGKVPENAQLSQGRSNVPAHSCSALNEKKRKFSMQHAKTAAALSKNTNGIATSGPGGIRIIPTRLINLSQAHKNSNSNHRRKNATERRATIDTLQCNDNVKNSNHRRSSMPLVSEYESIKVGTFDDRKQKAINQTEDQTSEEGEECNEEIEKVTSSKVPPHSKKMKQTDDRVGPTVDKTNTNSQQNHENDSPTKLSEDEGQSHDSAQDESKTRKRDFISQKSNDSLEKVESMNNTEASVSQKRPKTDRNETKETCDDVDKPPVRRNALISNNGYEKPPPLFKLGNIRKRRGGILMKPPDSMQPTDSPYEDDTFAMRRRRSSGNIKPGDGMNAIETPLTAETLLSVRRRSSSNHMAVVDRRRSSSNSMAAAAEAVRRMEFERRRSSSNSMAAAAEVVRRMEAAERRRSSSNSMAAAAEVVRRMEAAERRRSSSASMAAAAEVVRRMEFERRRSSSNSMAAAAEVVRRMEAAERRRSSSASMVAAAEVVRRMEAAERRRSSSASMAAAAEAVRRMEYERRRSSTASMAAAAEVVRRMESSLGDEDPMSAVRRHSGGAAMTASAEAVRKMEASLTAESLIAARRRSSGGPSMSQAANGVRRMDASLGFDPSSIEAARRLELENDSSMNGSHGPLPTDIRRRLSGSVPVPGPSGNVMLPSEISLQLQLEREYASKQIEQGLATLHRDPNLGMGRSNVPRRGSFQRRVSFDPELMASIINGDIGDIDEYGGSNVPDVTQVPPGATRSRRVNLSVQEMAALGLLE